MIGELEEALPRSLAENANAPLDQVDVLQAQVTDLGDPGTCGEKCLQDGDVADEGAVLACGRAGNDLLGVVEVVEQALKVGKGEAAG